MKYIFWNYSDGLILVIGFFKNLLAGTAEYFSFWFLVRHLFSPWKRLSSDETQTGFNFTKWAEASSFNLVSRVMGFIARLFLIIAGAFFLVVEGFAGLLFVILWLVIPIVGVPVYLVHRNSPRNFIPRLVSKLSHSSHPIHSLFNNHAGKFVLDRLGLNLHQLVSHASTRVDFVSHLPTSKSYSDLIKYFVDNHTWPDEFFRNLDIIPDDLILAAHWWDLRNNFSQKIAKQPGIGMDLLFGYTPYLDQYSVNLGSQARSMPTRLVGRSEQLLRVERALGSGLSLVLVGQPGVGKKSLILELARNSHKRFLELNFNVILSATPDISLKKTILKYIFKEAASAGNVVLVVRDLQRLTSSWLDGYDFTDILEEALERKNLQLITLSTSQDYEKYISPNMRLRKSFETIEVKPLSVEDSMEILLDKASYWEKAEGLFIMVQALRKIISDSQRYFTDTPFPEKALEILDSVVSYKKQIGGNNVTTDDVSTVLAEKTGIPFTRLTGEERKKLGRLEEIIYDRLIGQDIAVTLIARSLRARTMGVSSENKPVGSFLFLGPTGVGKTETAKVLSEVYYGSSENILRFDMAEFATHEGVTRLIGSAERNQPGLLTTAIKNRSAGMLLLDEIEKAPPQIYNLFLTLLDEGYITDAFGRKINCQHLFFVATSNAGSEVIRKLVSQGIDGEQLQQAVVEHVLSSGQFSPEFINRFDGVVVFQPLSQSHLVTIASLQLDRLKKQLLNKNVYLDISPEVSTQLARDGHNPVFGARPMRRIVNLVIGDLLSKAFLSEEIKPGDKIRLFTKPGPSPYSWEKLN